MGQRPKLLPPQLAALALLAAALLEATFGERYRAYRANVRRWV